MFHLAQTWHNLRQSLTTQVKPVLILTQFFFTKSAQLSSVISGVGILPFTTFLGYKIGRIKKGKLIQSQCKNGDNSLFIQNLLFF